VNINVGPIQENHIEIVQDTQVINHQHIHIEVGGIGPKRGSYCMPNGIVKSKRNDTRMRAKQLASKFRKNGSQTDVLIEGGEELIGHQSSEQRNGGNVRPNINEKGVYQF
jgi:hypothetical protein